MPLAVQCYTMHHNILLQSASMPKSSRLAAHWLGDAFYHQRCRAGQGSKQKTTVAVPAVRSSSAGSCAASLKRLSNAWLCRMIGSRGAASLVLQQSIALASNGATLRGRKNELAACADAEDEWQSGTQRTYNNIANTVHWAALGADSCTACPS